MTLRYVTVDEVRRRLKKFQGTAATALTDDQIEEEAERAEDVIDSYMRATYVLPLVAPIDKYVVNTVLDITVAAILRIFFAQAPKTTESEKTLEDRAQMALNALKPPKPSAILNHPLLSTVRRNPDFSLTYLRPYDNDFFSIDAGPTVDQSDNDTFFRSDTEFGDNPDAIAYLDDYETEDRVYDPLIG